MDRAAVSRIAHGDLPFFNPLAERDVDEAIGLLDLPPGARVLDVACGNAELLRRIAARWNVEAIGYAALARLRELGELVLLGEGYWRREPSAAYLEALGGATRDELPGYDGLFEAAAEAGLVPLWSCVASARDWDRYEWTQVLNAERHGGAQSRERAAAARRRLTMPGGRETLGFALVLLRAC